VVPELDIVDVIRGGVSLLRFHRDLVGGHVDELRLLVDESCDEPRTRDAVDAGMFAGDPLHDIPPTWSFYTIPAAEIGSCLTHVVLISANGANFDIDYPLLLGLSYEDIGSGIIAFLFAALAFGLWSDRGERAERVVKSAALVGIAATLVDRFV